MIINGKTNAGAGTQNIGGVAGGFRVTTVAGPGLKAQHPACPQRAQSPAPRPPLPRNSRRTWIIGGSYEPKPRLLDMDVLGIDQVMIIPTNIDTYPWLQNAMGARAWCKVYNDWAYEYTQEDPERLFFAALLPVQDPKFAVDELYRVAEMGCRVGLIRPMDAMGNYPAQPKYEPLWSAMEETGVVYGMHPFPATGSAKPPAYSEQYSAAEMIARANRTSGLPPHLFGQYAGLYGRGLRVGHHGADVGTV